MRLTFIIPLEIFITFKYFLMEVILYRKEYIKINFLQCVAKLPDRLVLN